jgi:flagellar biosynthesis/type III secretory pathway chaperone
MSGTDQKLASLTERRQQVERELSGLSEAKARSENTALVDLEAALMEELNRIDQQIVQLQAYLQNVKSDPKLGL